MQFSIHAAHAEHACTHAMCMQHAHRTHAHSIAAAHMQHMCNMHAAYTQCACMHARMRACVPACRRACVHAAYMQRICNTCSTGSTHAIPARRSTCEGSNDVLARLMAVIRRLADTASSSSTMHRALLYLHACVRACVRVCVRACVRARACVCECVHACTSVHVHSLSRYGIHGCCSYQSSLVSPFSGNLHS